MKSFKTLRESRKSSRYEDAMMSRMPAHLDDPRVDDEEPKTKKTEPKKATQPVKESSWGAYREAALLEAALNVPTSTPEALAKKHGVTLAHIETQLEKGVKIEYEHTTDTKIAREIALDHLGEDPDYYTKLDKAHLEESRQEECDAETAKIRENKKKRENQKPHPFQKARWTHSNGHPRCLLCGAEEIVGGTCLPSLREELTPRERLSTTERLKPTQKPPVDHAQGLKKDLTRHDNVNDAVRKNLAQGGADASARKTMRTNESYNVAFNESAFTVGDKVHVGFGVKGGAGYVGTVHQVDPRNVHVKIGKDKFGDRIITAPHRLVSLQEGSEGMPFKQAVEHAKKRGHKVTFGTASGKWHSISPDDRDYHTSFALHPDEAKQYGLAKSLLLSTGGRKLEESTEQDTPRSQYIQHHNLFRKYEHSTPTHPEHKVHKEHHRQQMSAAWSRLSDDERKTIPQHLRFYKESMEPLTESSAQKEFKTHYKLFQHYDKLAHPEPNTIVHKHLEARSYHEKEMNRHYTNMTPKQKNQARLYEGMQSGLGEAAPYKVGDKVIAKIGPHKGQTHTVIHVHDTGHVNIQPDLHGKDPARHNRYQHGAARAHPDQVERAPLKEESTKRTYYASKQERDPSKWVKNRGRQFKHWSGDTRTTNVFPLKKKGINSQTVQEAFQSAKDKKAGKKDALPTDGANEPNKEVAPQGQLTPQDGGSQAPPAAEKKTNTPKPEALTKGKKLTVKGPGADDKFQSQPHVTPLTSMPDVGSPKSGSQGTR